MMAPPNEGRPHSASQRHAPDGSRLEAAPLPPEESLWSRLDEEYILTGLMVDPWEAAALLDDVGFEPVDFYRDNHRALYKELRRIMRSGEEPYAYVALPLIAARGMLEACGGERFILSLGGAFPGTAFTRTYARRVQHLAGKRRLLAVMMQGITEITDGESLSEIQTEVMRSVSKVALPDGGKTGHLKSAAQLSAAVVRGIHHPEKRTPCWPTGLPAIDHLLSGGLRPGGLYVIGGRAKNGKSTLALAIVMEMARLGHRYHIDSLEMTDTVTLTPEDNRAPSEEDEAAGDISKKMVAYVAGVNSLHLSRSPEELERTSPGAYGRIREAHLEISTWEGYTDARPGRNIDQITAQVRRLKAQYSDLHVLLVDHAGLVRSRRGEDRRNTMIGVTNELKILAKELGIVVLLCAQINRAAEGRPHPLVSDLKESGSLEEDCDGALLVMNPKTAGITPDCIALWVSLPVHRHGPSGDHLWLDFDPTCGRVGLECPDPTPRDESTTPAKGPRRDWRSR